MKKDKDFKLKIVELVIQAVIALAALITAIKSHVYYNQSKGE